MTRKQYIFFIFLFFFLSPPNSFVLEFITFDFVVSLLMLPLLLLFFLVSFVIAFILGLRFGTRAIFAPLISSVLIVVYQLAEIPFARGGNSVNINYYPGGGPIPLYLIYIVSITGLAFAGGLIKEKRITLSIRRTVIPLLLVLVAYFAWRSYQKPITISLPFHYIYRIEAGPSGNIVVFDSKDYPFDFDTSYRVSAKGKLLGRVEEDTATTYLENYEENEELAYYSKKGRIPASVTDSQGNSILAVGAKTSEPDSIFKVSQKGRIIWRRKTATGILRLGDGGGIALDVDKNDNIYILIQDPEQPERDWWTAVEKFAPSGKRLGVVCRTVEDFAGALRDLTVDDDGNIYISGDSKLEKFSPSGVLKYRLRDGYFDIHISNKYLYGTNPREIHKRTLDGRLNAIWTAQKFK